MKKLLLLLALPMLFTSCGEIVDDGYVGIKKSMGKVDRDELKAGFYFYLPIVSNIFEMDIRERGYETTASTYSNDNQIIDVSVKVNYRPDSTQMAELYSTLGSKYESVILPQRVMSVVKEAIGKHKATELASIRGKVEMEIGANLKERLSSTGLIMESFAITNFDYDDAFEDAVKRKVVAVERAIEEKNRSAQVEEQAKQKLELATAEAEAAKILGDAIKQNKGIVEMEAVKKWNGVLPTYMMGNTVPFINLQK